MWFKDKFACSAGKEAPIVGSMWEEESPRPTLSPTDKYFTCIYLTKSPSGLVNLFMQKLWRKNAYKDREASWL
jgi:hypothetical protein